MMQRAINTFMLFWCGVGVVMANEAPPDIDYWTIEGLRSQQFSVGIFIFMIIGVLVFFGIIASVSITRKGEEKLKTGEKVLLLWIILGSLGAVVFGAMQLLHGRLF